MDTRKKLQTRRSCAPLHSLGLLSLLLLLLAAILTVEATTTVAAKVVGSSAPIAGGGDQIRPSNASLWNIEDENGKQDIPRLQESYVSRDISSY